MSNKQIRHWDAGAGDERSVIMMARSTQFRIYYDPMTRRVIYEVGEYDLITGKGIRAAREAMSDLSAKSLDEEFDDMFVGGIELRPERFSRYFVGKMEQRLLFNLGLKELPV